MQISHCKDPNRLFKQPGDSRVSGFGESKDPRHHLQQFVAEPLLEATREATLAGIAQGRNVNELSARWRDHTSEHKHGYGVESK
jgi:hypothetical protein